MPPIAPALTVADLARYFELPDRFFQSFQMRDSARGVLTPFLDGDGCKRTALLRTTVDEDFPQGWPSATPFLPWGLWCLPRAKQRGQLFLVFSEADAWVLWYHSVPALALVDPLSLEAGFLEGNPSLIIHRHPSPRGNNLVDRVVTRLRQLEYPGRACNLRLSDGYMNLADLHRASPSDFTARLQAAVRQGQTLHPPTRPKTAPAQDWHWQRSAYIQPASVSSPLHPESSNVTQTPPEPPSAREYPLFGSPAWFATEAPEEIIFYLGRQRGEAIVFLQKALEDGPRPASELICAARGHGICVRTLRRAKKLLAAESVRRVRGQGRAEWTWELRRAK